MPKQLVSKEIKLPGWLFAVASHCGSRRTRFSRFCLSLPRWLRGSSDRSMHCRRRKRPKKRKPKGGRVCSRSGDEKSRLSGVSTRNPQWSFHLRQERRLVATPERQDRPSGGPAPHPNGNRSRLAWVPVYPEIPMHTEVAAWQMDIFDASPAPVTRVQAKPDPLPDPQYWSEAVTEKMVDA